MKTKFNLFNYVINQIKNNLMNDSEQIIEVHQEEYPTGVLQWFCKTQGAFKIDGANVKKYEEKGKTIWVIPYKDLNLKAPSLEHLRQFDKSEDKLKLNDEYRYEEMRAFTTEALTEYDGAYCKDNVEHLAYTDDCTFDLYAQMKGYTPDQLQSLIEAGYLSREELQMEYIEFLEQCVAADYELV